MFIGKNINHAISLLVTDIGGNIISNDTPYVCITNKDGEYFNGMEFVSSESRISMDNNNNGIYTASFMSPLSGRFSIEAKSEIHASTKQYFLEVYDSATVKYPWLLNTNFMLELTPLDISSEIICQVFREKDSQYLMNSQDTNPPGLENFQDWCSEIYFISILPDENGKYKFSFTPDIESVYVVQITGSDQDASYVLDATENVDSVTPVFVGDSTILSPDGSNSTLTDTFGKAIAGVKIVIRDTVDKEIAAVTSTDNKGKWGVSLKPGVYHFFIEKDGYISVSFIRTVV